MNILKPCSYHYLFSHIPTYTSAEEARKTAEDLVSRLVKNLQLTQDNTEQFEQPHPDVLPLSFRADEDTQTYLLQFLSGDLITTILTFNQTDVHEDAISYWKRTLRPNFPDTPNRIGQTTVLFAQAETDMTMVQEITKDCFGGEINETLPHCLFDWGTLYFLPELERHSTALHDSRRMDKYILLVPDAENLGKGDQFLSLSFPMLEAIRQKLVYEEHAYRTFRTKNLENEREINKLLDTINQELSHESNKKPSFEEHLNQVDERQATLYQHIAQADALLLTLEINIANFETYLDAVSLHISDDTCFLPLVDKFRGILQQIDYDLKYIKFLLPGMDKREELLRLKIEWKRKEAEESSNKIREITNALIFAFGAAIGIGQVLAGMKLTFLTLTLKLAAMGIGGCFAYALSRWVGKKKLEGTLKELSDGQELSDKIKKLGEP